MYERTGTPGNISLLQVFALVTIVGAIFLNTAPYIDVLTNPSKSNKPAATPTAADKPAVRVVAHAEVQGSTKPKSATATVQLQPGDASPPAPRDAPTSQPNQEIHISAEALPLPHPAPKQGSAILTFAAPWLPAGIRKRVRAAIPRSEVPPLPARAPKKVESRIAGSTPQQTGRASWYNLDSITASGEKMDEAALTAAHRFLPFGTKVRVENIANGRSVVVRINDRGPFVAGLMIDLSKAAAEALDMMAAGVAEVRLSMIYETVASAGHG